MFLVIGQARYVAVQTLRELQLKQIARVVMDIAAPSQLLAERQIISYLYTAGTIYLKILLQNLLDFPKRKLGRKQLIPPSQGVDLDPEAVIL